MVPSSKKIKQTENMNTKLVTIELNVKKRDVKIRYENVLNVCDRSHFFYYEI